MLSEHIERKDDKWSKGSRKKIQASIAHKIRRTFVGALEAIEKELGLPHNKANKALYARIRSRILGIGNEQMRNMELELERYNIEYIPYNYEFRIISIEELIRMEEEKKNGQGKDI